MIKLLMRFWDAEKGEISISGKPIKEWSTNGLRALESYVIQDTYLFEDTIENNVKLARLGSTHEQVVEACKKQISMNGSKAFQMVYDTVNRRRKSSAFRRRAAENWNCKSISA